MSSRHTMGLVTIAVVVASILMPTWAWALYASAKAETNTFQTHVLLAPGRPTCGGLNLLQVPLSWTAPSDAAYVLSYELGRATSSGGPYTYTGVSGTSTTVTIALLGGDQFFVVRTVNHAWRGAISLERRVSVFLGVATCPGP